VKLTEILDTKNGLVYELAARNCISDRHRVAIQSKSSPIEMNEELLEIIQRRSYEDFVIFIKCLQDVKIGQGHVASIILEEGCNYFCIF